LLGEAKIAFFSLTAVFFLKSYYFCPE